MEIIGSQKKTCPEKRGHTIGVLLTVESQVTLLKLEQLKIKDEKWEACSAATRECTSCQQGDVYIKWGCAYWRWHSQKSVERCLCY